MRRGDDLIDQRFARLTVLGRRAGTSGQTVWVCRCDCGNISMARTYDLRHGRQRSCGCLQRDAAAARTPVRSRPEYGPWAAMKTRCANPANRHYDRYGGRGIVVCDRWRDSFAAFLADMGPRPTPEHTIERTDNDGPYGPENCRWATRTEQARNRKPYPTNRRPRAPGLASLPGSRNPNAKLTEDDVRAIRASGWMPTRESGKAITIKTLAERHGVSKGVVQRILEGKVWRHVT